MAEDKMCPAQYTDAAAVLVAAAIATLERAACDDSGRLQALRELHEDLVDPDPYAWRHSGLSTSEYWLPVREVAVTAVQLEVARSLGDSLTY